MKSYIEISDTIKSDFIFRCEETFKKTLDKNIFPNLTIKIDDHLLFPNKKNRYVLKYLGKIKI